MKRKLFTAVLLLAGCVLVGLSFLPTRYQNLEISINNPQADPAASVLNGRVLHLTLPFDLPTGEATLVQLDLPAGPGAATSSVQLIEGRLDLPGTKVFPAAIMTAPFHVNQPVSFRWLVTAGEDSPLPGRIWLTLIATDNSGETRTPVLARPLELEVRRVMGMILPTARWIGAALAGFALLMSIIQLSGYRRRRNGRARAYS